MLTGVPTAGSVAWWAANSRGASSAGHVAYSETIYSDGATVEEYNWTTPYFYDERLTTISPLTEPNGFINFGANGLQASVARMPGSSRLDVFVRGVDGGAWHAHMSDGQTLSEWESLGGFILGAPNAAWNAAGTELDVFAVGTAGNQSANHPLLEKQWLTDHWTGWTTLSTGLSGTSAREELDVARALDSDRLDLFVRGADWYAWHATIIGGTLGPWEALGLAVQGAPTAAWRRVDPTHNELDAFAIGADHKVHEDRYSPASGLWSGWSTITSMQSGVAVTEQVGVSSKAGSTQLDIFVRGTSGEVEHNLLPDGVTPSSWDNESGHVLGAPTDSWSGASSQLDAFVVGVDYHLWQLEYTTSWRWVGPLTTPTGVVGTAS